MKLVQKTIFILFTAVVLLTSCEKEIDIKLHSSEPRLVIEGRIAADSLATVSLTKTKDYGPNNDYPAVDGAVVTITDDAGNTETLKQDASGLYRATTIIGVQGRSYNLTVDVENKIYTSKSTMPYAVPIDSLFMYKMTSKIRFPMVRVQDPAGIDNYYRYILYLNGKRMIREVYVASDEDRDGRKVDCILHFNSEDNNDDDLIKGDHVLVEMQCIDKGAHKFFETWRMMGQSLANPTSNITGGALGYFSAYTSEKIETIADWED